MPTIRLIHDVAIQNLPVVFALDRAGLVGADGATHNGAFDLAYLRCIPNLTVMAPADENECRQMLYTAFESTRRRRCAIRAAPAGVEIRKEMQALPLGKGELRRQGAKIAILAFGSMLKPAFEAAEELDATVANMRFVKPLDEALVRQLAREHELLVTVEEGSVMGGAGSAVAECLAAAGLTRPLLHLGLPDRFVDHGDTGALLAENGLNKPGLLAAIRSRLGA